MERILNAHGRDFIHKHTYLYTYTEIYMQTLYTHKYRLSLEGQLHENIIMVFSWL